MNKQFFEEEGGFVPRKEIRKDKFFQEKLNASRSSTQERIKGRKKAGWREQRHQQVRAVQRTYTKQTVQADE